MVWAKVLRRSMEGGATCVSCQHSLPGPHFSGDLARSGFLRADCSCGCCTSAVVLQFCEPPVMIRASWPILALLLHQNLHLLQDQGVDSGIWNELSFQKSRWRPSSPVPLTDTGHTWEVLLVENVTFFFQGDHAHYRDFLCERLGVSLHPPRGTWFTSSLRLQRSSSI